MMIEVMVKALINFYFIEVRPNELKRDLLVNLITNMTLSDEVYFLLYNLYSIALSKDLHHLS
jgi:hypothetical protein